ncbi:MAG: hypothetical protein BJ554DRAFT_4227, partial [Olpidium bornovanus]
PSPRPVLLQNSRPISAIGPGPGTGAGSELPLSPPRSNSQTPAHSPPKDLDQHSATSAVNHTTSSPGMTSPLSPISPARPGAGFAGVTASEVWNAVEPAPRREDLLSPPPTLPRINGKSQATPNGASHSPDMRLNEDARCSENAEKQQQQQQQRLGKARGSAVAAM